MFMSCGKHTLGKPSEDGQFALEGYGKVHVGSHVHVEDIEVWLAYMMGELDTFGGPMEANMGL